MILRLAAIALALATAAVLVSRAHPVPTTAARPAPEEPGPPIGPPQSPAEVPAEVRFRLRAQERQILELFLRVQALEKAAGIPDPEKGPDRP